jgi:isopentenyl-diphosphate delta-isomerase
MGGGSNVLRKWQSILQKERVEPVSPNGTLSRKTDHLRINVERDVAAKGIDSGFRSYGFVHNALPEIDYEDVDTSSVLFGRRLAAPVLISCMTGGTGEAARINRRLAQIAARHGFAMGLGSARALLEHPETLPHFDLRDCAPDTLLFVNIGAVQLNRGYGPDDCRRLVDALQADALVLHLNPLQEAIQPEGDRCFRGLLKKIGELCRVSAVPVVVKEVGWGLAPDVVRALVDVGVAGIDVAGAGGTSWSEVERYRMEEPWRADVAAAFAGWGLPTADALRFARAAVPGVPVIASGGIADGLDVAKALALGADAVGIAGPFLRAADGGIDRADAFARTLVEVLRVAMFAVGAASLDALRSAPRLRRVDDSSTWT